MTPEQKFRAKRAMHRFLNKRKKKKKHTREDKLMFEVIPKQERKREIEKID